MPNNCTKRLSIVFASILLALFADTKIINHIVTAALPSLAGGLMSAMYGIEIVGLFIVGVMFKRKRGLYLSSSQIAICFICILWYIGTIILVKTPSVSALFFFTFAIAPLIIPGIVKIDVRTFLLALLILPSFGILYINQIIINEVKEFGVVSMGACYAFLIPILANLVYLRFYFSRERKIVKWMLLIFLTINICYLVLITLFGSRGPVLCAILLIICLYIIKQDNGNRIAINKSRLLLVVVITIFIALSFIAVLQFISDYLKQYDISINVVDKFLRMSDNDMSNGRNEISDITNAGILQSIIWGHGISQFENNTGIVYPHNFILQFLYDGGIVLTSCVLIPVCRNLLIKIKTANFDEIACLLFLFFSSVPGALFSGDLWEACQLWLLFGFVLSKN